MCICSDAQKCQAKYEKLAKAEKTGANVVKAEAAKKAYQSAKDEFDHQNRCDYDDFLDQGLALDYFNTCRTWFPRFSHKGFIEVRFV